MLVRGVIRNKIKNQLQAAFMHGVQQLIEVRQSAEYAVEATIIGDVVAEILHGRRVDRSDPQDVHPQLNQIIEPGKNSLEISNSVVVCILKRPRVHLVDNPALPPS